MTGNHLSNPTTCHLVTMPKRFWTLCDQTLKAWQQLNLILDRERKILLSRDLKSLWTIIGSKNALAQRIKGLESDLDFLARQILTNRGINNTPSLVALRDILHPMEVDRFTRWKTRLELAKAQAYRTNKATLKWITQEMNLGRQLIEILCGKRGHENYTTYARPGDKDNGTTARARHDSPGVNTQVRGDLYRHGVCSYQINQLHGKQDGGI